MKEILQKLIEGNDLTHREATSVFTGMLTGALSPAIFSALLTALKVKGESVTELTALVRLMREHSVKIKVAGDLLDTCGTGGKPVKTFNVSTCAAFVLAASGVKVAKHGNRSFSGKCGSADVLEALGIPVEVSHERVRKCIEENGFGFLYAAHHHPVMKNVGPIRRELGIRTVFNLAGPLTNPAGARYQVLGVPDRGLTETVAGVLRNLNSKRALVVWGEDVCDEVTTTGRTTVSELDKGKIRTYTLTPRDFGLKPADFLNLRGGSVIQNARTIVNVLKGKDPVKADIVMANAATGLVVMGKAGSFKEGVRIARDCIQSGAAYARLEAVRSTCTL
jgi:anthranilate phosphoribosyltransferase